MKAAHNFLRINRNKMAASLERYAAAEILKCNFNAASSTNEIPSLLYIVVKAENTEADLKPKLYHQS